MILGDMIERIENTELFLMNGSVVKRDELIAQRDRFRAIIRHGRLTDLNRMI